MRASLQRAASSLVGDARMIPWRSGTEKQRVIEALRDLPDEATIADAIERLCFMAKVERGLQDSDARRLATHDEVKKRFT